MLCEQCWIVTVAKPHPDCHLAKTNSRHNRPDPAVTTHALWTAHRQRPPSTPAAMTTTKMPPTQACHLSQTSPPAHPPVHPPCC